MITLEKKRTQIQEKLDRQKTTSERNQLGQFSTPFELAKDITEQSLAALNGKPVDFFDPALGTGAFYSALLELEGANGIGKAKGYEIDPHYGVPAKALWQNESIEILIDDFTKHTDCDSITKFNHIVCNPPYVRHHHISAENKKRLKKLVNEKLNINISGYSGLYCYFLLLSHSWLKKDGISTWLIPSEFMDVNYGVKVKEYLLNYVRLLRVHRFDPSEVQFDDALVSSVVLWFTTKSEGDHNIQFTYGGSVSKPQKTKLIKLSGLTAEAKWTNITQCSSLATSKSFKHKLSDFFTVKRGLATGANNYFILSKEQLDELNLPIEYFSPILPSPRSLKVDEITTSEKGLPNIDPKLFLLNTTETIENIRQNSEELWNYLDQGVELGIDQKYLCSKRKVWYFQEQRDPAPILCGYMGRSTKNSTNPFRFIFNASQALASNSYHLLYPKGRFAKACLQDSHLIHRAWEALSGLEPHELIPEGRVYGGGFHKLEPKELANINASFIHELMEKQSF